MKRAQLFIAILSGLYAAHGTNTREYHFVRRMKNWHTALRYCRDKYTELAAVHSQDESDKLHRLLQKAKAKDAWIGLLDDMRVWKWSLDGSVFNNHNKYESWKPGQPSRTTEKSSCVTAMDDGDWQDAKCDSIFPSVCYNETGPTKYILVNNTMTFFGAKVYCRSLYSGLASIRNQTEKEIIAGLVTERTWIGLNRKRYSHWSTGLQVKFTNWNKSQPDIPESIQRRCSLVSASTGKWFEESCGKTHHFVCERIPQARKLKLKLKFRSGADMNDPAVIRQITEQIHAKLKNVTSGVKVSWVAANGQVFHKEKKDEWKQSDRFEC